MSLAYEQLVGRTFVFGVRDCFAIVRDFYRDNFAIEITNYARPTDWEPENQDLIRSLYEREGFRMITDWKVGDLRPGDVLALAISEGNPCHLAVYVGDNMLIHHLDGRMSAAETYRDFWRNSTCFVLRHTAVPDLRPVYPNADLRNLLRDRYDAVKSAA